jgi:hypothetical protein
MSSADSGIAKAAALLIIPTILSGGALLPLLLGLGLVWLLVQVAGDAERDKASRPTEPPPAPSLPKRRRLSTPIDDDPDEDPGDPYSDGHHRGLGVSAEDYADNQRNDD